MASLYSRELSYQIKFAPGTRKIPYGNKEPEKYILPEAQPVIMAVLPKPAPSTILGGTLEFELWYLNGILGKLKNWGPFI
jgi:hypothetical protein